ncbi:MAG: hypothetical protein HY431_02280, partial [Candidatus Levybacteria bacterium]|nr:hypothetical protein [Candidatus Levybacteria bacterium]
MNLSNQQEILKTLLYSDIFQYPLTENELWRFAGAKMNKDACHHALRNLTHLITKEGKYYYLTDRRGMVKKREERVKESERKVRFAKESVSLLRLVPSVVFIGISGSVAMKNCKKDDDIDLFIIARKNIVWFTRLCVLLLLQLTGKRRRRYDKTAANQICVNMFMSENALIFSRDRHSLYTAHEVIRMIPIFERGNVYNKFLHANSWVKEYLPNSLDTKRLRYKDTKREGEKSLNILISQYLNLLEPLAKAVQLWY